MPKKTRIAISARGLNADFSGPQSYIDGFIRAFSEMAGEHDVYVYYNSAQFAGHIPKVKEKILPKTHNLIWDHLILPRALKKDKIDVAIFPKGTIPLISSSKNIPIMLDMGYFFPKLNAYKKADTLYMRAGIRYAAKHSWGVFAISQHTANDVIRLFKIPKEKILNISGGVDSEMFHPERDENILSAVRQNYKLEMPFIFYPTSISPRKNIVRVLDAFEKIQKKIPHHLYFTGKLSWNCLETEKRLAGAISARVHRLGSVPLKDMSALYSLSAFTIYPSLFEGLGLPLLEAFLCESPVLTSDQTSLPEVAGDAALIVSAYDTDAIAKGMLRLAEDENLRQSLVKKGKERAKLFTWKITVKRSLDWINQHFRDEYD